MMDEGTYDRSIAMRCSTCGGADFEYDEDDEGPIRCTSCDRVFIRDELVAENGEVIEAAVDEIRGEVAADLERHMRDALRRTSSGSRLIKVK